MRTGKFNAWMNITNDPRFILQQKKRAGRTQTVAERGDIAGSLHELASAKTVTETET